MARKKASEYKVEVGNIREVSGKVTIAGGDVYEGYTVEQVSLLLKEITTNYRRKPFDGRCPYKGLDVFEEEDADLFFGRERLVADLLSRVKESRTVFITGPSGSGKSSLVRAGLIHALKQGKLKGSERWLYEIMKPGREPIKDLSLAFSRLKGPELTDYFLAHANETDVLNKCAEAVLSGQKTQRFVLFVDQFEEVFTQINQEEERQAFINMLAHAGTVENGRVIVLFAMRSDFVSNCATYPALNELLSEQFRQIGAMQPEELVSAIALPAKEVGLPIEDELIARIINDMKGEPGVLPLMQFALKDLFDSQQEQGGVIALTLEDYLRHGGIQKSLERHADASLAALDEKEQDLARSIFGGLIEIGRGTQDTRRTALFDELVPANAKAEEVLAIVHRLADARLIITDEQAGKDTVTISHEKLIEAWPWLKKLVNENRDAIALQNEIASDAKEWEDQNRDGSYLYIGARLATAREKIKTLTLSERAQAFVEESIKTEEEARQKSELSRRRTFKVLISITVVILSLLVLALLQLQTSRALQLGYLARSSFLSGDYYSAGLYALQSNKVHKNEAATLVLNELPYENFMLGKSFQVPASPVGRVAWSADGRLASTSGDNTVTIWNLITGKPAQTLIGNTSPIYSVAWSADGQLASGAEDGSVIIWDLSTSKPSQILHGHTVSVSSMAWSADGRLASISFNPTDRTVIIIWDLSTGRPAQIIRDTDWGSDLAWSPDGRLASASKGQVHSEDGVIIWDLATGKPAQILRGGGHYSISDVAWSIDGRVAAASGYDTVFIWDLSTEKPTQILHIPTGSVYSVAWSADGILASGTTEHIASSGAVIIWDLATGKPAQILQGHTGSVYSMAWSTDGQLASASDSNDNALIIWSVHNGKAAQVLHGHTDSVSSVAWSTDGRLASGSWDNTVIVWDLATGKPALMLHGHTDSVSSVAWSVDGQLASGAEDGSVIIWDLATGEPSQILHGHQSMVSDVAWSADGQLASASTTLDDRTGIIIWDLSSGKPGLILRNTGWVKRVAWSPDGQLASTSYDFRSGDDTVIIWDLTTGKPAQMLHGHTSYVTDVAWSTDGQLASESDNGTVIIWNLATSKPAQTLREEEGIPTSIAWSTNRQLASAFAPLYGRGWVIIWNLDTGEPIQTLSGQIGQIYDVAWSADGRLASASADNTISISQSAMTGVSPCDWILRNMSVTEWEDTQGSLYPYEATCLNLPKPELTLALTWKGRLMYLGIVLFNIVVTREIVNRVKRRLQSRRILIWTVIALLVVASILANIFLLAYYATH